MKLRVNWAPEKLMTFKEVLAKPGYYLNGISGDIYRQDGMAPEATLRHVQEIERAYKEGLSHVEPAIWLAISDNLDLTEAEVRALLRDAFMLRIADQGRFVGRLANH